MIAHADRSGQHRAHALCPGGTAAAPRPPSGRQPAPASRSTRWPRSLKSGAARPSGCATRWLAMFPQMDCWDDEERVRRWRLPGSALVGVIEPRAEAVAAIETAARECDGARRGRPRRAAAGGLDHAARGDAAGRAAPGRAGHRRADGGGGHRDAAGAAAGDRRRRAADAAAGDPRHAARGGALRRRATPRSRRRASCVPTGFSMAGAAGWSRMWTSCRRCGCGGWIGSSPSICSIAGSSGGRISPGRLRGAVVRGVPGGADRRGAAVRAGGGGRCGGLAVPSVAEHRARAGWRADRALSRRRGAGDVLAPVHVGNGGDGASASGVARGACQDSCGCRHPSSRSRRSFRLAAGRHDADKRREICMTYRPNVRFCRICPL